MIVHGKGCEMKYRDIKRQLEYKLQLKIAKRKNFPSTLQKLKRVYGQKCFYCYTYDANTLDHVLPKSKGGVMSVENGKPACKYCNLEKGDMTIDQWLDKLRGRKLDERHKYIMSNLKMMLELKV